MAFSERLGLSCIFVHHGESLGRDNCLRDVFPPYVMSREEGGVCPFLETAPPGYIYRLRFNDGDTLLHRIEK